MSRSAKLVPAAAALMLSSCAYMLQYDDSAPPIRSVRVPLFQCACPDAVTAEAVRNAFIVQLTEAGEVQAVKDGPADVVLEGTITIGDVGGAAVAAGPNGGRYVSGVTVLAYRGNELIASRAYGQNWNRKRLLPPERVAGEAAQALTEALYAKGLKPR